jgi:hypothetical protein
LTKYSLDRGRCNARQIAIYVFFGVGLALGLDSNVVAQKNKPPTLHALPGNGVTDSGGKTGFFPNASGGIDALNLATGKVLWSSKEANLPLIVTPRHLFALEGSKNQLRVIKIDTGKKPGQRLFASPLIPLPNWASVDTAYGRSFRSSVRSDGNGLFLIWEARAFYAGGAAPPPDLVARETKYQNGVERIDINTGKIESLNVKKIAAGKFFPMSEVVAKPKLGSLTLLVKERSIDNTTNPVVRRRSLQAVNAAKQIVWQRDIAPQLELPPLP